MKPNSLILVLTTQQAKGFLLTLLMRLSVSARKTTTETRITYENSVALACKECRSSQVKKFFIPSKENGGATHKEQRQCKRLTLKKYAKSRLICHFLKSGCSAVAYMPFISPKGRRWVSDVLLLSGISGLPFDSPFPSPLSVFCQYFLFFPLVWNLRAFIWFLVELTWERYTDTYLWEDFSKKYLLMTEFGCL